MNSGLIFYVIDTESNGLLPNIHELCELSIIRGHDRVQLSRQVRVEKPENSSIDALRIINKTASDLRKGISKRELISDVERFVDEDGKSPEQRCLIGHNVIGFDKRFLLHLWDQFDKQFPFNLYLDTMHLIRAFCKKNGILKPKVNLQAACDIVGIKKVAGMHNAISDTRNCYLLWKRLMEHIDCIDHIKRIPHREVMIEQNDFEVD